LPIKLPGAGGIVNVDKDGVSRGVLVIIVVLRLYDKIGLLSENM
jgi:hypothetical protein